MNGKTATLTFIGTVAVACLTVAAILSGDAMKQSIAEQQAKSREAIVIELPAGRKLVSATWSGDIQVWLLTRDMLEDDRAETYEFYMGGSKHNVDAGAATGRFTIKETPPSRPW